MVGKQLIGMTVVALAVLLISIGVFGGARDWLGEAYELIRQRMTQHREHLEALPLDAPRNRDVSEVFCPITTQDLMIHLYDTKRYKIDREEIVPENTVEPWADAQWMIWGDSVVGGREYVAVFTSDMKCIAVYGVTL